MNTQFKPWALYSLEYFLGLVFSFESMDEVQRIIAKAYSESEATKQAIIHNGGIVLGADQTTEWASVNTREEKGK